MEKSAKIAALLSFLAGAPAAAQVAFIPCDYAIPVQASALVAPLHRIKHRHHRRGHRRPVGAGGRLGLHHMLALGMCPVWAPEELGGPVGFEPFGGGLPLEDASTDLGGEGSGSFGGFGGGGDASGSDLPDLILFTPDSPIIPPLDCCSPAPSPVAPIPEAATWALILAGFAAIFLKKRRAWLR